MAWLCPKTLELPSCMPSTTMRDHPTMSAVHFCRVAVHACSSRHGPLASAALDSDERLTSTSARAVWPRLIAWIFAAACATVGVS